MLWYTDDTVETSLIKPRLQVRHYTRAPITEAIIDFRVLVPESARLSDLSRIEIEIKDRYPTAKRRMLVQGQMSAGDEVSASAKQRQTGYLFYSADGKDVFQADLDGFTLSRLAPYESWQPFRERAQREWSVYERFLAPSAIQRVAVRYINTVDIPGSNVDFDEYFLTIPKVGPNLPQGLSGFLMQLRIPQPDIGAEAILTQTIKPPSRPNFVSVVLDIDVFVQSHSMTPASAWEVLEILRVRKNELFEGSITDKARRLFD